MFELLVQAVWLMSRAAYLLHFLGFISFSCPLSTHTEAQIEKATVHECFGTESRTLSSTILKFNHFYLVIKIMSSSSIPQCGFVCVCVENMDKLQGVYTGLFMLYLQCIWNIHKCIYEAKLFS